MCAMMILIAVIRSQNELFKLGLEQDLDTAWAETLAMWRSATTLGSVNTVVGDGARATQSTDPASRDLLLSVWETQFQRRGVEPRSRSAPTTIRKER